MKKKSTSARIHFHDIQRTGKREGGTNRNRKKEEKELEVETKDHGGLRRKR